MNTKLIMMVSAGFLAVIGLALTFMPNEIASFIGITFSKAFQLVFQILGALYFSFAMLNWMAKGAIIGGIYNRPIAIANFTHFLMGSLALVKVMMSGALLPNVLWVLVSVYALLAIAFWFITFRHPVRVQKA